MPVSIQVGEEPDDQFGAVVSKSPRRPSHAGSGRKESSGIGSFKLKGKKNRKGFLGHKDGGKANTKVPQNARGFRDGGRSKFLESSQKKRPSKHKDGPQFKKRKVGR